MVEGVRRLETPARSRNNLLRDPTDRTARHPGPRRPHPAPLADRDPRTPDPPRPRLDTAPPGPLALARRLHARPRTHPRAARRGLTSPPHADQQPDPSPPTERDQRCPPTPDTTAPNTSARVPDRPSPAPLPARRPSSTPHPKSTPSRQPTGGSGLKHDARQAEPVKTDRDTRIMIRVVPGRRGSTKPNSVRWAVLSCAPCRRFGARVGARSRRRSATAGRRRRVRDVVHVAHRHRDVRVAGVRLDLVDPVRPDGERAVGVPEVVQPHPLETGELVRAR